MSDKTSTAPLFEDCRLIHPKEVMRLFKFKDRESFLRFAQASGIPFIRMSPRKVMFEESAVRAWLDSRRVGGQRFTPGPN